MPSPEKAHPPLLPLVVFAGDGSFLDAVLMDRKAYKKSLEQKRLWYYHHETGRVLPYGESFKLSIIQQENGYYKAVGETTGTAKAVGTDNAAGGQVGTAEPLGSAEKSGQVEAKTSSILGRLSAIIEERKSSRPEGSYTTYLFDEGPEKIRKKTGEEAVELILARNKEDIIAESADFLYHLMVYLSAEGLSLEAVLEELARRHEKG